MLNRTRWLLAGALAVALIVALAVSGALFRRGATPGADTVGRDPAPLELRELRDLREAVAACHAEVEAEQARFQAHQDRVDSLHAVVRGHESDDRTVPAAEFDDYLEAFDAYNEAVRHWHDRAAALQTAWEECRALAERHNERVDSLTGGGTWYFMFHFPGKMKLEIPGPLAISAPPLRAEPGPRAGTCRPA
jgi:hypothetical protein